jgi:hypothetical protein
MITPKKTAFDALREALVSLIEKLIAEEPHEAFGFEWAARPQPFYCEKLDTSSANLRRYTSKPPFVRKQALVGTGPIVLSGSHQIAGPKKMTLLRLGDPPPKDIADEAKRVMITIWNKKMTKKVTQHKGQCLWGMTGDLMKLLAAVDLPAELAGELAIAAFKYALADWQTAAFALKIAAEARPNYKPRYYDYPCITHIRSFWRALIHAYVDHLQLDKAKPPPGLEFLLPPKLGAVTGYAHPLWKIMTLTDPLTNHPGLTPEIDKAIDGGYAAAEAKFLAKLAAEEALEKKSLALQVAEAAGEAAA